MVFLANENFPGPSIRLLREAGYQIISVLENYAGFSDEQVIALSNSLGAIILTFDKDYGELIFRYSAAQPPAVVFFRDKTALPEFAAIRLMEILEDISIVLNNSFTIVQAEVIRQRRYAGQT